MIYSAHCDIHLVVLYLIYRNMLFCCRISSSCYDLFHRFSAADHRHAGLLDDGNHLTAVFTFIEFHIHSITLL